MEAGQPLLCVLLVGVRGGNRVRADHGSAWGTLITTP